MAARTAVFSPSYVRNCRVKPSPPALLFTHASSARPPSYNSLVFQAARLLGPPARFEASKLKVLFMGEEVITQQRIVPRTYTLSHCDFTADLTLTISNLVQRDQVLEAVVFGDSDLFREHKQLMDALVRVYFHSSSKKYNRMECWGPLKDAALVGKRSR
ncbi:UNVERIFIED_CONTAM: Magnesium dechelatase SGRL, chloroplastic [Sesamum calycinum]|uniref:Magnesium dechelatase SGRL, chloroplastic n=1 Tax=Sesamum calycinum TaxID=2727403 RepID=A0AAW2QKR5_9LAMI